MKIENASFSYDSSRQIFHNINIQTVSGELFCLMGRNGCGKSTLLDCILGIHSLQEGRILLADKDIGTYKPMELARHISYVPQVHIKSFPYKVKQVVLMGRTVYLGNLGVPQNKDKQIVEQVLAEVGISELAERPYTQLSGGEMQLVVLARALAQTTPIIVMDEPTAHLDFYNELMFLEKTAQLILEKKRTVLMATHSPSQAFFLENCGVPVRVGLMYEGQFYAVGKPKDILSTDNMHKVYGIESRLLQDGGWRQLMPVRTDKEY